MKKIISLALAVMMLVSLIPTVHAYEEGSRTCPFHNHPVCDICNQCVACNSGYCDCSYDDNYTKVEYTATTNEAYTVTVPATLAPGGSGEVAVEGTWGSNRRLVVSADKEVELVNSLNAYDRKTLAATFSGIKKDGNNTATVTATEAVSVGDIENALFGTWSGAFFYDVEMINVPGTFDLYDSGCVNAYATTNVEFEKGATWRDFVNSRYNTAENSRRCKRRESSVCRLSRQLQPDVYRSGGVPRRRQNV